MRLPCHLNSDKEREESDALKGYARQTVGEMRMDQNPHQTSRDNSTCIYECTQHILIDSCAAYVLVRRVFPGAPEGTPGTIFSFRGAPGFSLGSFLVTSSQSKDWVTRCAQCHLLRGWGTLAVAGILSRHSFRSGTDS